MSNKPPHVPAPRTIGDIHTQPAVKSKSGRSSKLASGYISVKKKLTSGGSSWKRLVIIVLVIGASLLVYNYVQTRNELKRLADPKSASQEEAETLTSEIGKFLELPDETPSVATVKNASQLLDQSFFSHTKNGDKVLIFPDAGKAVLYRPSSKKVIEFASVRLQDSDSVEQQ